MGDAEPVTEQKTYAGLTELVRAIKQTYVSLLGYGIGELKRDI